ncbi:NCS2 family nucleobase:cation symporter-2 [Microbacterium terrae]|uniref:Uric acid transporter UacT n=1 Tax=Microbacterium terrae TaxID=69369 RepID=A0A0M2H2U9_9MICO|nr:nucleobase:cation symporter-2 family protein [Microbacterium terrae]KJL38557.1 Uric acid transporter UacT [Microbacterium terrae]MBP1078799.1 NCS2 family nucleobase:cation symporter-2 [Microbacterium terrae]GLJ98200.1 uracil permease [Microbacterium terrae]
MTKTDDTATTGKAARSPRTGRTGRTMENSVDAVPPLGRLFPLGLQHVLAMYAGAVAVPLIVGGALGFSPEELAFLISADLFVAGLATIVQSIGFWRFGVRLPLMQGVTFAAVGPMIAIGQQHGVQTVFGAVIACGVFMILIAPFFSQLLRFFPPIVTGTVILIIGLSLMRVAAGWIMTGATEEHPGAPPINVAFAMGTLLVIVLIERFAPPALQRVSVLLGLVIGTIAALFVPGMVDWSHVADAQWFAIVTPFYFGLPQFEIFSILSMLVVGIVIMTETTGDMIAVGEIVEKPVTRRQLADGLRADGLGTVVGGIFNTFPYTAFAQNVGLVSLTGVRSRFVATMAGAILVVLGLIPAVAAVVEGVPRAVLGGAGIALFGMVAASGIRTLTKVRFNNKNVLIVAISVGIALLPTVTPTIYEEFPTWFQLIFDSGISAGAIVAILLNLLLNSEEMRAARAADPHIDASDAVRGPAAVALVHPDAEGTGLIPTQLLEGAGTDAGEADDSAATDDVAVIVGAEAGTDAAEPAAPDDTK